MILVAGDLSVPTHRVPASLSSVIAKRAGWRKKRSMKVSSFFALLCLAANVATAQSTPVDWQTLATEFSQDEAAASNKYQGQMITVTGPVSGIAQGDMTTDNPAVAGKRVAPGCAICKNTRVRW